MGKHIKIRAKEGGEFDCYLATPDTSETVPAIVLAAAVHGVDADIQRIADEFARNGFIAAAPDLFWRTIPGPLGRDDNRTKLRSQPRLERIKTGEQDMSDTLGEVRKLSNFNGRAVAAGFCYGAPYALMGPKRLGFDAGISFHGTQLLDFIGEAEGLTKPVCIIWGDQDHQAPPPVIDGYRKLAERQKNVELHVFPGVQHGYMMGSTPKAYDESTYKFSMERALALLTDLRTEREKLPA